MQHAALLPSIMLPVQVPETCLLYPWATEKYVNVSLICNAMMFRNIEVIMY